MKQLPIHVGLIALCAILSLVACKKDDENAPGPPQQHLPNPLPAHALVKQLKWSENDHETMSYNAKGQVAQLRSQWQYVAGDPSNIRTIVYDFQYDAQDRPVGVDLSDGYAVKYYYKGNRIDKTEELYPGGAVAREVAYFYQNDRLSHEIWKVSNLPVDPPDTYKFEFGYDAKGNLNLVKNYQLDSLQQYTLLETIEYSDFDDRINPTSWMLRYPYLPQMQYQLNNPRKEVRYPAGGGSVTTNFQYEYNTQDLPVSQQKTTNTGSLTTQYQY